MTAPHGTAAAKAHVCSMSVITRYQKRISGPLLDRIDIHVEVPRVEYDKLTDDRHGEPSAIIQARVQAARERQLTRFSDSASACNADMGPQEVEQFCPLEETGKGLMRSATPALRQRAA